MDELFREQDWDIVVIGAGPAGSSAARAAAQKGVKVLLVERKHQIGIPVQCAELVSKWIFRHASFSPGSLVQSIETMKTHLPDGTFREIKSPGYMLDRALFDRGLATSAVSAGAQILTGTKALVRSPSGVLVAKDTREQEVRARVIIGGDGVHSAVARWTGQPSPKTIVALQVEVVLFHPQNSVDIFFHPDYEGGYAWFFPKGNTANAGVGVIPSKTSALPELLELFLIRLVESGKLPRVEIVSKTGGSIPCELRQKTVFENILLVGDAAGHAHPITGAGIFNAIIAGEMAGRIAAEAVAKKDLRHLVRYEKEWREDFGKSISYGSFKRKLLEKTSEQGELPFNELIRSTWIGFKEYYQERKKWEAENEKSKMGTKREERQ